jgi:DNA-binding beta-propeller fold protein YncE
MSTTNALTYEVVEGWEQLPAGWSHPDVAGVAVAPNDQVYLFCRAEHPIIVYDRDGRFVKAWGEGLFQRPHGITIGPDGMVYCADDLDHTVRKYTPDGELIFKLGTSGQPSDTGYDGNTVPSIVRGGPPFNRPTNIGLAANGDLYISDGYGNARVHHFSAAGELLHSWGEPGTGPGQFNLPHGIWVHQDGRVFVGDRENDRIQIFSPAGEYLTEWTDVIRPTQLFIDPEGLVYVSELVKQPGHRSFTRGICQEREPGRVSVFDGDGKVLARWDGPDPNASGSFCAPHSIGVDSHGDIYVAEVTRNVGVNRGYARPDCHTFQKFARR